MGLGAGLPSCRDQVRVLRSAKLPKTEDNAPEEPPNRIQAFRYGAHPCGAEQHALAAGPPRVPDGPSPHNLALRATRSPRNGTGREGLQRAVPAHGALPFRALRRDCQQDWHSDSPRVGFLNHRVRVHHEAQQAAAGCRLVWRGLSPALLGADSHHGRPIRCLRRLQVPPYSTRLPQAAHRVRRMPSHHQQQVRAAEARAGGQRPHLQKW
mmetsp:Transcript_7157/g.13241  ORF Transcript_7157/g.13241 Transcript_7157/m.13241 type:complete len:210 (+) Transcript_7157:767-1396(+)